MSVKKYYLPFMTTFLIFSINTKVKSGLLTSHNLKSLPEYQSYKGNSVVMAYSKNVEESLV
jgi:hypothetical protein